MATQTKASSKENVATPEITDEELLDLTPLEQATKINKRFVLWSSGAGLIPFPMVDIATILTAQITMLAKMTKAYNIPFSEHRVKNILIPLFSSVGVVPAATVLLASLVKFIPVIGQTAGLISLPVMSGAISYATGKVFISHFEAGGTLLDFNPEKMKDYYKELLEEGKTVAKEAATKQQKASQL
jgi:uncharacterized protein (DUF697 family)